VKEHFYVLWKAFLPDTVFTLDKIQAEHE